MMQKFILIGCGGSGGKSLRYVWREVDRRLRARGWTEGPPVGFQFLHIDVPTEADGYSADEPRVLDKAPGYLGLAKPDQNYGQIDRSLTSSKMTLPAVGGWRPNPNDPGITVNIYLGAGQDRAVGHVVAVSQLAAISNAIDNAVSLLDRADTDEELFRLGNVLGTGGGASHQPRVILVSSIGGGAGSGIFLSVLDLLRSKADGSRQWLGEPLTTLFTSDIFSGDRPGVIPNSLAAITELTSAHLHTGDLDEDEYALLKSKGLTTRTKGRRSSQFNFLIGRRNPNYELADEREVYQSFARNLASLITSPKFMDDFQAYFLTNWSPKATTTALGTGSGGDRHGVGSMGYASVGLGVELFQQYAAERIARASVERLRRGHERHREPGDRRSEADVIEARAEQLKLSFFHSAALYEFGDTNNEILDALRDQSAFQQIASQEFRGFVGVVDGAGARPPTQWIDLFHGQLSGLIPKVDGLMQGHLNERTAVWVEHIQKLLLNHTAQLIAAEGFPVALSVLAKLDDQLQQADVDLENEAFAGENAISAHRRQRLEGVEQRLRATQAKELMARAQEIQDSLSAVESALVLGGEIMVRRQAQSMIRALRVNLVDPLKRSIANASTALSDLLDDAQNRTANETINSWPTRGVPARLLPTPNQFLLMSPDTYPDELERLIVETIGNADPVAVEAAVTEMLAGTWTRIGQVAPDDQSLIDSVQSWTHVIDGFGNGGTTARTASFRVQPGGRRIDPATLLDRANDWLLRRQGAVSTFVASNLTDFLDPAHERSATRTSDFVAKMALAAKFAHPLVTIGESCTFLHSGGAKVSLLLSSIPNISDADKEELSSVFQSQGVEPGYLAGRYDASFSGSEVEIIGFLNPIDSMAIETLAGPMRSDWAMRSSTVTGQQEFWSLRRTRPLPSFVPVPPETLRAMCTGWFAAILLGWLDFPQGRLGAADSAGPVRVWGNDGDWLDFPRVFLGGPEESRDEALPAILLSLPVALLEASSCNLAEVHAYERLIELSDAAALRTVLTEDGWPNGAPSSVLSELPKAERVERLATILESLEAGYTEMCHRSIDIDDTLEVTGQWELRKQLLNSVQQLRKVVDAAHEANERGSRPTPDFNGLPTFGSK